jgi:hypothetical protein
VNRTILAVVLLAMAPVGCGAEPTPIAGPDRETLLARVGDSLVTVDARSGRTLGRVALGAHDASLDAVYTAASDAAAGTTTVTATDPVSGRSLRSIDVPGRWVIPVAAGATPEGAVSGDGELLVLAGTRGKGLSRFALLDTDLASKPHRFALRGRYDFDAMAPDGSALFLSEIADDGHYRVRAYDVASGRLRSPVVVEKTAVGLLMQGEPVTRAVDPTGSPVHTLYRGGPEGAFVHSLDTQRGTALCIFLPDSRRAGPSWRLALDTAAGELHALNRDLDAHYVIDPMRGEVTPAPPDARLPSLEASSPDGTRTYTVEPGGRIAVHGSAGELIRSLPSPSRDAELIAVRPSRE